jgi:hypothetical protein
MDIRSPNLKGMGMLASLSVKAHKIIPIHVYTKQFTYKFPDRSECKGGFQLIRN